MNSPRSRNPLPPATSPRGSAARAASGEQAAILKSALDAVGSERPVAAFDLDSTTFSNRPRQARIVREFGAARGDPRLASCGPASILTWDLRDTLRLCGCGEVEAAAIEPALRAFWRERFFTSEYCRDDEPIAGAAAFLVKVLGAGGQIVYVTGRHAGMEEGTLAAFRRAGFPLPDGERVQLWLKPQLDDDDDAWKEVCHSRLARLRALACAFDNEPTHVNAYKRAFPEARVVRVDTDHSGRPVEVLPSIPSISDFWMGPE